MRVRINVLISTLPWSEKTQRLKGPGSQVESPKAERAQRPSRGPRGQIGGLETNDYEGSTTHGIKQ